MSKEKSNPPPSSQAAEPPVSAPDPQASEYVQPHLLGIHLPTPGDEPAWPFQNIGKWAVDVAGNAQAWRRGMRLWRREHLIRMGYDDAQYRREELGWSQSNYVHAPMMVEDRYFYDPSGGEYTVDRYLDDLERRFGGIDSVLIWYVYPNIGIDDRNQFDLARDLPGGIEGLKQAVADFHRRDVRVFLPTMPWDNGTREAGKPDWQAIVELAAEVGADGINGDTYYGVPRVFREVSDAAGQALVLQAETWPIADDVLAWNNQSWGKASTSAVPAVSKLKWLEPRHLTNVENRWARDRIDDFHYIFFNGHGYTAWENVWGIWNQFTPRDGEALRRIATLFRRFTSLLTSADWEPYAETLQQGVFASRFPGSDATLWTLVNRNEYELSGEQLRVEHKEGVRYYDLWNGVEMAPRIDGEEARIDFAFECRGFGAILAVEDGGSVDDLDRFLQTMRSLAAEPLSGFSTRWTASPQAAVPVAATEPAVRAPEGMVAIPAGDFDFRVTGIEIEGYLWNGLDVQYP